ncbi:MAG TPA: hypothetical protein VGH87_29210 [Polyangiaceae bacterium]
MNRLALGLVALTLACGNSKPATKGNAEAATTSTPPVASSAAQVESDASAEAAAPPPEVLAGADFATDAKTLFRVAACGNTETPVPDGFDAATVDAHCKEMAAMFADYKKTWMDIAMPFIAKLIPQDIPKTVVYPFGGGDLLGVLATYPNGTEVTTISLEIAADIRKVESVPKGRLAPELARYRLVLGKLFEKAHSRTDNLDIGSKSALPGEIVFDLVAMVVHGFEPTSLRYFKFADDGTLHYFDQAEIDAGDAAVKANRKTRAEEDDALFSNMELRFRKKGDTTSPARILRHVAFNLDDNHMKANGRLLKYLEARGPKIAPMTKAASHLLWSDEFSIIRNYLATHMDFMISDSTGFTPAYAKKMGFVQDTYGTYTWPEPFGTVDVKNATDLQKLFVANPHTDITFRYGYPDKDHHGHIVVTHKPK